jgi:hypothetical protein
VNKLVASLTQDRDTDREQGHVNELIPPRTQAGERGSGGSLDTLRPEELSDGVVVYDVTAEPVFDSDEWMQNAGSPPRGPPSNRDGIDPPTPAE